jgi:hypothetical protein
MKMLHVLLLPLLLLRLCLSLSLCLSVEKASETIRKNWNEVFTTKTFHQPGHKFCLPLYDALHYAALQICDGSWDHHPIANASPASIDLLRQSTDLYIVEKARPKEVYAFRNLIEFLCGEFIAGRSEQYDESDFEWESTIAPMIETSAEKQKRYKVKKNQRRKKKNRDQDMSALKMEGLTLNEHAEGEGRKAHAEGGEDSGPGGMPHRDSDGGQGGREDSGSGGMAHAEGGERKVNHKHHSNQARVPTATATEELSWSSQHAAQARLIKQRVVLKRAELSEVQSEKAHAGGGKDSGPGGMPHSDSDGGQGGGEDAGSGGMPHSDSDRGQVRGMRVLGKGMAASTRSAQLLNHMD